MARIEQVTPTVGSGKSRKLLGRKYQPSNVSGLRHTRFHVLRMQGVFLQTGLAQTEELISSGGNAAAAVEVVTNTLAKKRLVGGSNTVEDQVEPLLAWVEFGDVAVFKTASVIRIGEKLFYERPGFIKRIHFDRAQGDRRGPALFEEDDGARR
ncbi:MAG: hypothetical protein HY360_02225 [Verrucomicrobia bacterium]|nr:hypothetical protein [Verrucomicrobiota bacterium]